MKKDTFLKSALGVFLVIAASIFFSELLVMIIISFFPTLSLWPEAFLDAGLLIVLVSPILYIFLFRPFVLQINERERAEIELRNEKVKAQRYFDVAGVILMVLDLNGNISLINRRGTEILEHRFEDVIGKNWVENFIPEELRTEVNAILALVLTGESKISEYHENSIITGSGKEKLIAWHNSVLTDEDGKVYAVLSSGEDITLQKMAEDALKNAHDALEARVKERTAELSKAKDELEIEFSEHKKADEAFKRANRALKTLSDFNHAFVHTSDEPELLNEICRIIIETGGYHMVWIGYAKDDDEKTIKPVAQAGFKADDINKMKVTWAENKERGGPTGEAIRTHKSVIARNILVDKRYTTLKENAEKYGFTSFISVPFIISEWSSGALNIYATEPHAFDEEEVDLLRQLTANLAYGIFSVRIHHERKKAQEELIESESKFRSLTQSATDAIVTADSNGTIIGWNNGAEEIFGHNVDEVIGKDLTILMPERYRDNHKEGLERVNTTGKSKLIGTSLELVGLRKDGNEFPLELSLAMWKTGKGRFFSGIIRDITDRKLGEEERKNIQAQLLHAQKLEAIGRLIVGVAHDFSNIILSIKGYSKATMKELGDQSPLYRNMSQIQQLVDRGSKVTRQLLLFGRKQPILFVELDMNETIESLLKMIDNLIRADIKVTPKLAPELWTVKADRSNMDQVLMNLIVNARDAIPGSGKLTITTENITFDKVKAAKIQEARPGDFICVTVSDTGMGMEKTVADRIFDPFFTTKGKDGTGLGLSVVYGIINSHNGWINVESKPGKGTTFRFYLPQISEEITNEEETDSDSDD
ncbi:MAG: PAS domain S-box protein [Thermodesulfobacteriota bacterium]